MNHHDIRSGSAARSSGSRTRTRQGSPDLLSNVLGLVRLNGERIYSAELGGNWGLSFDAGPGHFIYVKKGTAFAVLEQGPAIELSEGDLLLLAHGSGHRLRGGRDETHYRSFETEAGSGQPTVRIEGPGEQTLLLGGSFTFAGNALPSVLEPLPAAIRVSRYEGSNAEWLGTLSYFLLAEATNSAPGATLMISRLIDVLVIRTIRSWAEQGGSKSGWLGAVGDPQIGKALLAIHDDPFRAWMVADLARLAAMSRSVFADRFASRIGVPPLRYLTNVRLVSASDLLGTGVLSVGEVARRVGYASEAAFSRAYKARYGYPPVNARPRLAGATYSRND
ncbi:MULTISPECIES: AraC family transcriptional regulator [unclassified Bradyrhizobium]|uniref:AraC family transcriptional regulator n=1 Tax=unclassified Bradyrhizobium TaxID=2631580 RepID=UPI002305BA9A|nr:MULTISPECIES: AraC family transcriptional regulator [unclassified Bradyrhizobium]